MEFMTLIELYMWWGLSVRQVYLYSGHLRYARKLET